MNSLIPTMSSAIDRKRRPPDVNTDIQRIIRQSSWKLATVLLPGRLLGHEQPRFRQLPITRRPIGVLEDRATPDRVISRNWSDYAGRADVGLDYASRDWKHPEMLRDMHAPFRRPTQRLHLDRSPGRLDVGIVCRRLGIVRSAGTGASTTFDEREAVTPLDEVFVQQPIMGFLREFVLALREKSSCKPAWSMRSRSGAGRCPRMSQGQAVASPLRPASPTILGRYPARQVPGTRPSMLRCVSSSWPFTAVAIRTRIADAQFKRPTILM